MHERETPTKMKLASVCWGSGQQQGNGANAMCLAIIPVTIFHIAGGTRRWVCVYVAGPRGSKSSPLVQVQVQFLLLYFYLDLPL